MSGAGPLQGTCRTGCREVKHFGRKIGIGLVAISHLDQPRRDRNAAHIVAADRPRRNQPGRLVGIGEDAMLRVVVPNRIFRPARQTQPLGHLRADGVVLISGYGNGRQNTDDGDHDHQLDEGEATLKVAQRRKGRRAHSLCSMGHGRWICKQS